MINMTDYYTKILIEEAKILINESERLNEEAKKFIDRAGKLLDYAEMKIPQCEFCEEPIPATWLIVRQTERFHLCEVHSGTNDILPMPWEDHGDYFTMERALRYKSACMGLKVMWIFQTVDDLQEALFVAEDIDLRLKGAPARFDALIGLDYT